MFRSTPANVVQRNYREGKKSRFLGISTFNTAKLKVDKSNSDAVLGVIQFGRFNRDLELVLEFLLLQKMSRFLLSEKI